MVKGYAINEEVLWEQNELDAMENEIEQIETNEALENDMFWRSLYVRKNTDE